MDAEEDLDKYMNVMGGNGMDMMDIMEQTQQQMASPMTDEEPANGMSVPLLIPHDTTQMHRNENALTGQPLYRSPISTSPNESNNLTINLAPRTYADVTINLAAAAKSGGSQAASTEPFMDDDLDEFDAKDDLTKDQQKQDGNVHLARRLDEQLNRVADEVMNIDEIEQQYRMTKDPENPKNIFVLKFGKDEEQHWRLPWNPTTNLMCHMEPNKLLIEQSKYNSLYIKTSITPHEYKKQAIVAKKKAMMKVKEKNKQYKLNIATHIVTPVPDPNSEGLQDDIQDNNNNNKRKDNNNKKPQTTKFSLMNLATPASSNGLLSPSIDDNKDDNKPRGTFMANNSMLIHSAQTVNMASPTDQQKLIEHTQQLHSIQTQQTTPSMGNGSPMTTPITAQIRPELIAAIKPAKKPKHGRRVSLASIGDDDEWNNEEYTDSDIESDDDDDDDDNINFYGDDGDDDDGNKKRGNKLGGIQLSVSISKQEDQDVQRLDDDENNENDDFGRSAYEQQLHEEQNSKQPSKGKLGIEQHIGRTSTKEFTEWSPPKMTLEKWNAVDVWQGILFLGDEWDALNYLEIMDNSIEYFVNCATGYCAFQYETKLKYYWLENWRRRREKEREKQKLKNSIEREKRRKIRLKKFQRAHPEWRPKKKNLLLEDLSTITSNNNNLQLDEMVQFAIKVQPTDSPVPRFDKDDNKFSDGGNVKTIRFKVGKNNDIKEEFEYFKKEREEYKIIESLHNEILDLEVDDSDHSSMYDSCMSSDEYQYDSDEYDEYLTMSDQEIINKLCPFKFLNIYAHNWEGYRLLDLHMNDVWNFIEECRMKNMDLKKQWKTQKENVDLDDIDMGENKLLSDKPPKVSCLIFCTKNNIPMDRLNSEITDGNGVDLSQIGHSICTITDTYKNAQVTMENNIWNKQIENFQKYLDMINEQELKNDGIKVSDKQKKQIKNQLVSEIKKKNDKLTLGERYAYQYWELPNSKFWNDFELLKTRDAPLNRLFGSSSDRSSALVLGFMIHSGIRLKQEYKALLLNKANTLRNQSFLRQLIQLDWMKHCFAKPGMKEQVPFRDEYECYELDKYLIKKEHYNLK